MMVVVVVVFSPFSLDSYKTLTFRIVVYVAR